MRVLFLTHPEVQIDTDVPVVEWGLTERGRDRARALAGRLAGVGAVVSSPEVKAEQAARVIAEPLGLPVTLVGGLAEVDRAATGYLAEPDFWANYQEFLERPTHSARGWETAVDAQLRIVATVEGLLDQYDDRESVGGDLLIMSHGGVGALLLAQYLGTPIQRLADQPGQGSYFVVDAAARSVLSGWQPYEDAAALSAG